MFIPSEQLPDELHSIFWGFRIFFALHIVWFALLLMYVYRYIKALGHLRDYLSQQHPQTWEELGQPVLWAYQKGFDVRKLRGLIKFLKTDERISDSSYPDLKARVLTNMDRAMKTLYIGLGVFTCALVVIYMYLRRLLAGSG